MNRLLPLSIAFFLAISTYIKHWKLEHNKQLLVCMQEGHKKDDCEKRL